MKFIGYIGPKGSGKDSAFEILLKKGKVQGKLSFAGPLKDICSKVFGIPPRLFVDPILKEKPFSDGPITLTSKVLRQVKKEIVSWLPEVTEDGYVRYNADKATLVGVENRQVASPRELLQVVGTEFIRERVYQNWHVEAAFGDKVLSELDGKAYAITDIRFENELEYLRNKFGSDFTAFYVERPEAEERLKTATHASELTAIELRKMVGEESVLQNNGSLEDFEKTVLNSKLPDVSAAANPKKKSKFIYDRRG